jgi:type VI protein secretion system component VasK
VGRVFGEDTMTLVDLTTCITVIAVIGSYVVIAGLLLKLGEKLSLRSGTPRRSRFVATLRILAALAFLIGVALAWMAYASGHPMKEQHLLLPLILPALVYGCALLMSIEGGALRFVRERISAFISRIKRVAPEMEDLDRVERTMLEEIEKENRHRRENTPNEHWLGLPGGTDANDTPNFYVV